MTDSPSTLAVVDGAGVQRTLGTMLDGGAATQYPQHQPRVNSAPVSTANPMPTADATAEAALATANTALAAIQTSAAAGATAAAQASILAELASILAKLNGTLTTADANDAAFQGVIPITPGTTVTAGRSLGFICTTAGNVTLTLANGSTITVPLVVSASLQTLPFAVTNVTEGTGAAATFWNLV